MNTGLLDRITLLIVAVILLATILSLVFSLAHFGLEDWYGFTVGAIIYVIVTYYMAFRLGPKKERPRGRQLVVLSGVSLLMISVAFALFYFNFVPLTGPGSISLYTGGAFFLAIATDYCFKCYRHRKQSKRTL